jgi:hypothetical protein
MTAYAAFSYLFSAIYSLHHAISVFDFIRAFLHGALLGSLGMGVLHLGRPPFGGRGLSAEYLAAVLVREPSNGSDTCRRGRA